MKQPTTTSWKERWQRWQLRLLRSFQVAFVLFGLNVVVAVAETITAPGMLSWIDLRDSDDVNVWSYTIHLGKPMFDFGADVSGLLTEFVWELYRSTVVLVIWFLDWVLSFDWFGIFIAPIVGVGDSLKGTIDKFNLTPTLLLITAVAVGLALMRGKYATAVYETVAAGVVFALATGALASPTQMIVGDKGWISQTREYTMQFAAELSTSQKQPGQAPKSADEGRKEITSMMMATFVRKPSQIINFGRVIDGTDCQGDYTAAVKEGRDKVRDAIGRCNREAFDYSDKPTPGMLGSVFFLLPASFVILALVVIMCGAIILALFNAAISSLKMTIDVLTAILPGGARRSLAASLADVVIGLGMFIGSVLFLLIFLQLVQEGYGKASNPMKAFIITDIMLVVGIVAFIKFRGKISAAASRLSDFLTRRPDGKSLGASAKGPSNAIPTMIAGAYGARQAGALMAGGGRAAGRAARATRNAGQKVAGKIANSSAGQAAAGKLSEVRTAANNKMQGLAGNILTPKNIGMAKALASGAVGVASGNPAAVAKSAFDFNQARKKLPQRPAPPAEKKQVGLKSPSGGVPAPRGEKGTQVYKPRLRSSHSGVGGQRPRRNDQHRRPATPPPAAKPEPAKGPVAKVLTALRRDKQAPAPQVPVSTPRTTAPRRSAPVRPGRTR